MTLTEFTRYYALLNAATKVEATAKRWSRDFGANTDCTEYAADLLRQDAAEIMNKKDAHA